MRTACYARFSSEMQRETSIDDQVRECREYAKRQGWQWQPAQVYSDKGISGKSIEGRPGLQSMLEAAQSNRRPFDVLLVDDSSRVARDLPDALRVLQQLKFAGVRVVYISQNIDSNSEQAETLITVHGLVDGLYLREMAAKIKRGLRGQHERGFATGGITYGYRSVPVPDPSRPGEHLGWRIEIADDEAATVRQAFEWYAAGLTATTILARLKADPKTYPAPRGGGAHGVWKRGALDRVLTNERYTGRQIWGQRQTVRKPGSRKTVTRSVPRKEWAITDRPELRIVSDALWQQAQARRRATSEANKSRRQPGSNLITGRVGATHGKSLFTGFMTCGVCGGSMSVVNSRTVNGVSYTYYGCYDAHRNGAAGCRNRVTVRAEHADPILLSGVQAELTRPEMIDYAVTQLTAALRKLSDGGPEKREALNRQRDEIKQKVQRLLAAIEGGVASPTLGAQLQARERELAGIEADIKAIAAMPPRKIAVVPASVKQALYGAAALLGSDVPTTKAHFTRLGLGFTVTPVYDVKKGERPYLRADGTGDFAKVAFGAHDLLTPPPAR